MSKLERKTIEKNRRMLMKDHCLKLASLIPKHHKFHKDTTSQEDRFDQAALYIKELRERVEELKRMKQSLTSFDQCTTPLSTGESLHMLEIRELMDTALEVVLITSLNKNFEFHQVIRIIHEEGGDVVHATFSTVGDKVFHTIHAQVKCPRVGIETSRLFQRINKLVAV